MKRYDLGSEWRKWDLHVHVPGTKLNNGYETISGKPDIDRFCKIIEESDVEVIGLTDYFSLDAFYSVRDRFIELYSESSKVLLPNLELRLTDIVNKDGQAVNAHLIFRPDLPIEKATRFCQALKTSEHVDGGIQLSCVDLTSATLINGATVSKESIAQAIREVFGKDAAPSDNVLFIVSAKGDGIRAGGTGVQRKAVIVDEIDKQADAIFGNTGSRDWYLQQNRYENKSLVSRPKPVFGGSDAHNFDQLVNTLGKQTRADGSRTDITWIKADPTFEGLQQTLIEPAERVILQESMPDVKEPYKVIREIRFPSSSIFPESVKFNSNLTSIIGSRSSGKSALLAYIAHAVDPAYTVKQQSAASGQDESKVGPAAAYTWAAVAAEERKVVWADPTVTEGQVIYIPQNSLYEISEQPREINKKIRPALFRKYDDVAVAFEHHVAVTKEVVGAIKQAVSEWFEANRQVDEQRELIKQIGDKTAITNARNEFDRQVIERQVDSTLSAEDMESYQAVSTSLVKLASDRDVVATSIRQLEPYVVHGKADGTFQIADSAVRVQISSYPDVASLPVDLAEEIDVLTAEAQRTLQAAIETKLLSYRINLASEDVQLISDTAKVNAENADLIVRNKANTAVDGLLAKKQVEQAKLDQIQTLETALGKKIAERDKQPGLIDGARARQTESLGQLEQVFGASVRSLEQLTFGMETDFDPVALTDLGIPLKKNAGSVWIVKDDLQRVDMAKAATSPAELLTDLATGSQKLNRGYTPEAVVADILSATPEVRFSATLDGDGIGGFAESSMTPGKQALFALTLILNEAQEPWPLLIDQPEDDLDSRSIYESIVPYLVERKRGRQIIMVSHNANLVIGADSEQVIVANRHGSDRRNKGERTFDYLSGSLEHSRPHKSNRHVLQAQGIREHACIVLDGGQAAFQKRKDKYKI
ncbi:TrlF family AAA-like ATPase [Arthrobacter sp. HLT1-20]